jgi:signal-transduction protein with cAMP-binding, CBS, and nucleotidyltransferase domain
MKFFNDKKKMNNPSFVSWLCPLLVPMYFEEGTFVFEGGDVIEYIYFLTKGKCHFVLPEYNNARYISINNGDHFGIIDLVASTNGDIYHWLTNLNNIRR